MSVFRSLIPFRRDVVGSRKSRFTGRVSHAAASVGLAVFYRLFKWKLRHSCSLFESRRIGEVGVMDYDHWRNVPGLPAFEVWKAGPNGPADLMAGVRSISELWRQRGDHNFVLRIADVEFTWQSGLSLALLEQRRHLRADARSNAA